MKRAILLLFTAISIACAVTAGTNQEMVIVKQITDAQRRVLPDKTIEYKLRALDLNTHKGNASIIAALTTLIDTITHADLNNTYYTLSITPTPQGDLQVVISSLQELPPSVDSDTFMGIFRHMVVMRDKASEKALKQIFTGSKTKVNLVQEFEIVDEVFPRHPALLEATITSTGTHITTMQANGSDITTHPNDAR